MQEGAAASGDGVDGQHGGAQAHPGDLGLEDALHITQMRARKM
jgi:hypothetical protein